MQEDTKLLIFSILYVRILKISKKYGMGSAYIKGQLDEAYGQLTLAIKKNNRGKNHGL